MEETKNKLPNEYIEEALKLKDEYMKKMKEYINNSRHQGNKGRDYGSEKEKEINQEFNYALKKLQKKYNIE
ncbi:MAG: hypothetical protein NC489_45155 [Ruminococcus flavefaciens]|nr:hypothetical protein [Ruminococcus flavefaciens]